MVANDEFIETAEVHGNFYGTAKAGIYKIQGQKKITLLDIDVQGANKFENKFPHSNFIFICPASLDSMKERMIKSGTETEQSLQTRLANAPKVIEQLL